MNDPVNQLLVLVGVLAVAIVLMARQLFYWKARALEQERAAKHWFARAR